MGKNEEGHPGLYLEVAWSVYLPTELPIFKIKILLNKDMSWVLSLFIIKFVQILHTRGRDKMEAECLGKGQGQI